MLCPGCGNEVDDATVFCPQCRYQFRETDDIPFVPSTRIPETPDRDDGVHESIFEEDSQGYPSWGKQCPACGNDVDEAAVFCPQCRFRFRETGESPAVPGPAVRETPAQIHESHELRVREPHKRFSAKELRKLDVQLMQPAFLVVLIISLFTYSVISTVPFIPIPFSGLNLGVTGIISLTCGLLAGIVFLFLSRSSLSKFRYQ